MRFVRWGTNSEDGCADFKVEGGMWGGGGERGEEDCADLKGDLENWREWGLRRFRGFHPKP